MPYALLAAAVFAISPLVAAQGTPSRELLPEECQTMCRVYGTAPPPCQCPPGTIQSGQSTAPQAVRARMREAYARRVETVDNYTALVKTSMTPIPVVQYFEKEIVNGDPVFRQVSPAEIAESEAEAGGGPTPAQMGAGLETVLGAVRGRAAQPDVPDLPAAAQGPLAGLLGQVADGLQDMFDALQNPIELETKDDLFQRIYQLDAFWDRAVLVDGTTRPLRVPLPSETCAQDSTTIDLPVYWANMSGVDLGPGSESYQLSTVAMWVGEEAYPIALQAAVHEMRTGRYVVIKRLNSRFRRAGPMSEPHSVQHSILTFTDGAAELPPEEVLLQVMVDNGLPGLFEGLVSMTKTILRLYINTGPPTAEDSATLIRQALEVPAEDCAARERGE